MSVEFSPLFLRRSRPLRSSIRRFTPSTCPTHPIHNAHFEDEVLTLTPAPLFAGQDRPLKKHLPVTTVESLLVTFDLIDEIDAFLDELLQDGTASRMREAEIAEAGAVTQDMLPPRYGSGPWTDVWLEADVYEGSVSIESDHSSRAMPSLFEYIDINNQLTNFRFKVSRRTRKMSEPISPKTTVRQV